MHRWILSLLPREWRKRAQHKRRSEAAKKAWRTRKLETSANRVEVARKDFMEETMKTVSKSTLLLLLALVALPAFGQSSISLQPNETYSLKACLFYTATGQPAYIAGVPVRWSSTSWSLGSGGHSHDTSASDGRPLPSTNTYQPQATGSDGCVVFSVYSTVSSGQYNSSFTIDSAWCLANQTKGVSCTPAALTLNVLNPSPYFGGSWSFVQQSNGHGIYQDAGHPLKNMYGDYNTMAAMKEVDDTWAGQYAHYGELPVTIRRISLVKGGYLDGYLLPGFWLPNYYSTGGNPDPHAEGYTWDMDSPITPSGKVAYVTDFAQYCPGQIYNFANHTGETAVSGTVVWHVFCEELPYGETAYPN